MNADPWLRRWLHLLPERAGDTPVLELGCGKGDDTAILVEAGFRVVAVDRSPGAIELARVAVPRAEFHAGDFRLSFPAIGSEVGGIIASLSLHYLALDDRTAVEVLFATGWRMLSLEELVIKRYTKPKVVWEAVLERGA